MINFTVNNSTINIEVNASTVRIYDVSAPEKYLEYEVSKMETILATAKAKVSDIRIGGVRTEIIPD